MANYICNSGRIFFKYDFDSYADVSFSACACVRLLNKDGILNSYKVQGGGGGALRGLQTAL